MRIRDLIDFQDFIFDRSFYKGCIKQIKQGNTTRIRNLFDV